MDEEEVDDSPGDDGRSNTPSIAHSIPLSYEGGDPNIVYVDVEGEPIVPTIGPLL